MQGGNLCRDMIQWLSAKMLQADAGQALGLLQVRKNACIHTSMQSRPCSCYSPVWIQLCKQRHLLMITLHPRLTCGVQQMLWCSMYRICGPVDPGMCQCTDQFYKRSTLPAFCSIHHTELLPLQLDDSSTSLHAIHGLQNGSNNSWHRSPCCI